MIAFFSVTASVSNLKLRPDSERATFRRSIAPVGPKAALPTISERRACTLHHRFVPGAAVQQRGSERPQLAGSRLSASGRDIRESGHTLPNLGQVASDPLLPFTERLPNGVTRPKADIECIPQRFAGAQEPTFANSSKARDPCFRTRLTKGEISRDAAYEIHPRQRTGVGAADGEWRQSVPWYRRPWALQEPRWQVLPRRSCLAA